MARHFTTPSLTCRQLTPLLRRWAPYWTRLELSLDAHGPAPRMQAFLRASSALDSVTWCDAGDTRRKDIATVQRALARVPTLQELRCLTSRPFTFPWALKHLYIGDAVGWSGRKLERLFQQLQHLESLECIDIKLSLDCREVVLSAERLAGVQLPSSLQTFALTIFKVTEDTAFDLSGLASERGFEFILRLYDAESQDELLRLSEDVSWVLQSQDTLELCSCLFVCEAAQLCLAELELTNFAISLCHAENIRALPRAAQVRVSARLKDWDFDSVGNPHYVTGSAFVVLMSWSAITAATDELKVELGLCPRMVRDNAIRPYSAELRVYGCPSAPDEWQAGLAYPEDPWRAIFTGFSQVSGLPPASSQGPERYEIQNTAFLVGSR